MIIVLQVIKTINATPLNYTSLGDKEVTSNKVYSRTFNSDRIESIEKTPPAVYALPKNTPKRKACIVMSRGFAWYDFYFVKCNIETAIKILNGQEEWQDQNYTFIEVERVYSTRIDCCIMPE